jgi:ribose 5-phosphate isomerase B
MRIAIGCDHAAFNEKLALIEKISDSSIEIEDFGCLSEDSVDYPDFAHTVCREMENNDFDYGILICGSGIGISIAANKNKGIRAALCTSDFHAEMSRRHNNANIIALGARVTSIEDMVNMVNIFINTDFEGGRHQNRVEKIEK